MTTRALPTWAIGAAIAILAVVAPALRVAAAPASSCTAKSGVTVIVDFTHFNRGIERGCAPGHPVNALAALNAAGFTSAGTAQYGDAFLCRIDDLPTPAKESCSSTPAATASWSFYTARPSDAAWTYSSAGVTSSSAPAGSLIAFAFGNYAQPGVGPSGLVTTTTTPTLPATTAPTRSAPAPTVAAAGITTAPTTPTSAATTPGSTAPNTVARTTANTQPRARAAASLPTPSSTIAVPLITNRTIVSHGGSGSAFTTLLGIVLIAALAVTGWMLTIRARRRRSA